jgi:hypothetical protein
MSIYLFIHIFMYAEKTDAIIAAGDLNLQLLNTSES